MTSDDVSLYAVETENYLNSSANGFREVEHAHLQRTASADIASHRTRKLRVVKPSAKQTALKLFNAVQKRTGMALNYADETPAL